MKEESVLWEFAVITPTTEDDPASCPRPDRHRLAKFNLPESLLKQFESQFSCWEICLWVRLSQLGHL